jgi:hypothetical protein
MNSVWYCLRVDEETHQCRCGYEGPYLHAGQWIVVWPTIDDPNMLRHAKEDCYDPDIIRYEEEFGPCMSYYELIKKNI